jgi:hypothetical protein
MRRVHVSLSFLLRRLLALPDTSYMGQYDCTGVPRIIQSGSRGQTGFCYVLACAKIIKVSLRTGPACGPQKGNELLHNSLKKPTGTSWTRLETSTTVHFLHTSTYNLTLDNSRFCYYNNNNLSIFQSIYLSSTSSLIISSGLSSQFSPVH